jgi:hypothetical protein
MKLIFMDGNKYYDVFVGVVLSFDDLSSAFVGEKHNPCGTCECRSPNNGTDRNPFQ